MPHLPEPDYLPTASLKRLQERSQLLACLREHFVAHGYWECETPILSRDIVVDANLDPFVTHDADGSTFYLQTSPEAGMKRLLAAGATAIFQVSRVMRKGEVGQRHNPEFTMVEWYRVGDSYFDQMSFVEGLVRVINAAAQRSDEPVFNALETVSWSGNFETDPTPVPQPFERLAYDAAFERFVGTRVLKLSSRELRQLAGDNRVVIPQSLSLDDHDGWLNLLLAELIEPQLGRAAPQFLCDYPASQAALARLRDADPPVAERFELYDRGVELCNGYQELTDSEELLARTQAERERRTTSGASDLPGASRLAEAMQAGLPPCCGVALGFDRLVMLALGCSRLDEVIAFPRDRA